MSHKADYPSSTPSAPPNAAALLEPLREPLSSAAGAELALVVRAKGGESEQLSALLDEVRTLDAPRLGTLPKEAHLGPFAEAWTSALGGSGLDTVDVASGVCVCECACTRMRMLLCVPVSCTPVPYTPYPSTPQALQSCLL